MPQNTGGNGIAPVSRRDALRAGVQGGAFVTLGGVGVVARGERVDVPVVMLGDEVAKTRTVPRRWWEHVQTARTVRESISSRFLARGPVEQVGTRLGSGTLAGRRKMKVAVHVSDPSVDVGLPDEVDGVEVEKLEAREMALTCDGNGSFDPVPGGVEFDDSASGLGGTTGCKVTVNGSPRMLTAYHIWDCNGDGDPAYQWSDRTGTVDGSYSNSRLDYATVTENNSSGIEYAEDIREGLEVRGYATNYEVLMSDGDSVYKTGRNTDDTSGVIDEVDFSREFLGCVDINGEGILVTNIQRSGDSGSVTWIITQWSDGWFATIVSMATFGYGTNCTADGSIGPKCDTCDNTGEEVNEYTKCGGTSSEVIHDDTGGDLKFD